MKKEIIKQIISGAFVFVVIASLLGSLIYFIPQRSKEVPEQVTKAMKTINEMLKAEGQSANLISFSKESGVYKIDFQIGDRQFQSFITQDGRYLFPFGVDLSKNIEQVQVQATQEQETSSLEGVTSSQP
jgi:hypothetical protein